MLFELAGEDGVRTQGECVVQHVDQLRQRYCEIYALLLFIYFACSIDSRVARLSPEESLATRDKIVAYCILYYLWM